MFVLSGNLQRFALTSWLVLALVGPAFAAVHAAWASLRHAWGRAEPGDEKAPPPPDLELLRRVSVGGQLATAAVVLWQGSVLLGRGADERFLLQHLVRVVRVGFLDVSVDLALDPAGVVVAAAVALASAGLFVGLRFDRASRIALANLASLGAVGAVLAAGWPLALAMLAIAGASAAALARSRTALATSALAEACTLAGSALLFWSLGGTLAADGYLPDLDPRVVAVQRSPSDAPLGDDDDDDDKGPSVRITKEGKSEALRAPKKLPSALDGKASISLAGPSGAIVYVDESRTPLLASAQVPAYAPFTRVPVAPGLHTLRVHVGGGTDDHQVQHVTLEPGEELVLATVGSVSTFREATDMVALRTARGPRFQELLAARHVGSWPALAVVFVLLALGSALRAAHAASLGASREPFALHALAGTLVVLRLAPLAGLLESAGTVLALVGAAVAASAAAWLALAPRRDALAGGAVAVCVGVGLVGAGAQAPPAVVAAITAAAFSAAALGIIGRAHPELGGAPMEGRMATAALVTATALVGAPLPGVGATWGLAGVLAASADGPLGPLVLALGAAATLALAFAGFRAAFAHGPAPKTKKKAKDRKAEVDTLGTASLALGALALALGAAVGFSPRLIGGDDWGPLAGALRPLAGAPASPSRVGVVAAFVAALGGFALARSRYRDGGERALERDAAYGAHRWMLSGLGVAPAARAATRAVLALGTIARLADDRIVGAAWGALGEVGRVAGALMGAGADTAPATGDASPSRAGGRGALVALALFVAVGLALYLWSNA